MEQVREDLRRFLNKECIWKFNPASTNYMKIYTSTTAVSPTYKPFSGPLYGRGNESEHSYNVTLIVMKPKKYPAYITIYINGQLMDCCTPEALFMKAVPGAVRFHLIYFGPFKNPSPNVQIPADVAIKAPDCSATVTRHVIWNTSRHITQQEDMLPSIRKSKVIMIGKCAWYAKNSLYQYFLSMDCMAMLPALDAFPSLARILSLLTRCADSSCVPCYGFKIHVCCASGYTSKESPGTSESCPCILSCTALKSDYAPVTGNKNLLSLLFDPVQHMEIVGIKFLSPSFPTRVQDVFCGVKANGEEIVCRSQPWELLQLSSFYTRLAIYDCQVLKRGCLHSC